MKQLLTLIIVALLSLSFQYVSAEKTGDEIKPLYGILNLNIIERSSGVTVPARIEVLGSDGEGYVAEDALLTGGDCSVDKDSQFYHLDNIQSRKTKSLKNRFTRTTQFYSTGLSTVELPQGIATIKVFKGPEYRVSQSDINIVAGKTTKHTITLTRLANMQAKGWYSADDHLHISRPARILDPLISKIMQAEDIHVANLLQIGKSDYFASSPQYAHGKNGIYKEGIYILSPGQENPRTHLLGHTITLGAEQALHNPEEYLLYKLLWKEAADMGAINGYAHFGNALGASFGLPVVLPHGLMSFVEVLQANWSDYSTWYEMLNLGFRITPTAGTDYPCVTNLPGHERFYTRVEDPFTYNNWLEGVRKGRTFVTTGPLLEFSVNGKDIGDDVKLNKPGTVIVEGKATFNPQTDNLLGLEIMENGELVKSFSATDDSGVINFKFEHRVEKNSWLALRGRSGSLNNYWGEEIIDIAAYRDVTRAHSAPIYINIKGAPPLEEQARAKSTARAWLARLEDLEDRLDEGKVKYLAKTMMQPGFDAVSEKIILKNRAALLHEIQEAKDFFIRLSR